VRRAERVEVKECIEETTMASHEDSGLLLRSLDLRSLVGRGSEVI
jgi:hypothetical protein